LARKKPSDDSGDAMAKNFETVTNLWSDFSSQMEDKLRDLFESSATEYQDIYKNWTEIQDKMSKQVMDFTSGNEGIYKNLYNSWKEYSDRLNTDFGSISKSDDKSYSEFMDFWSNYSENFNDKLSELMREGIKEQYELYELWMDTFAKSVQGGSSSGDVPTIINRYWLDVFNQFNDFFRVNRPPEKVEKPEPGELIYKQYEELYNYWLTSSQKMLDEVMRSPLYGNFLGQSINTSMDQKKMFENMMVQNIKSMGIPTRIELEEIQYELKNLSDRIDDLNKTIKELKKR
jgi:gas vesicle protein